MVHALHLIHSFIASLLVQLVTIFFFVVVFMINVIFLFLCIYLGQDVVNAICDDDDIRAISFVGSNTVSNASVFYALHTNTSTEHARNF